MVGMTGGSSGCPRHWSQQLPFAHALLWRGGGGRCPRSRSAAWLGRYPPTASPSLVSRPRSPVLPTSNLAPPLSALLSALLSHSPGHRRLDCWAAAGELNHWGCFDWQTRPPVRPLSWSLRSSLAGGQDRVTAVTKRRKRLHRALPYLVALAHCSAAAHLRTAAADRSGHGARHVAFSDAETNELRRLGEGSLAATPEFCYRAVSLRDGDDDLSGSRDVV